MARLERPIRQSMSLPPHIAKRAQAMAKARKISATRVIVDSIEAGIQAKEAEKERPFSLANQLTKPDGPAERQQIKEELARMTFGD